jgi:hypothetical protein
MPPNCRSRIGSSEVVFCQQGLQFFPDRAAAMREMSRFLDDAGIAISRENHFLIATR